MSGSRDKTCILWDFNRSSYVRTLKCEGAVTAVAISPNTGDIVTVEESTSPPKNHADSPEESDEEDFYANYSDISSEYQQEATEDENTSPDVSLSGSPTETNEGLLNPKNETKNRNDPMDNTPQGEDQNDKTEEILTESSDEANILGQSMDQTASKKIHFKDELLSYSTSYIDKLPRPHTLSGPASKHPRLVSPRKLNRKSSIANSPLSRPKLTPSSTGSVITLWSINGNKLKQTYCNEKITCITFTTGMEGVCRNLVIAGLNNGNIWMWKAWDLGFVKRLHFHKSAVTALTVIPNDHSQLVSGDSHGLLVGWKVKDNLDTKL